MDLPDEIWRQIFDLAADEDLLFEYGLPTTMAECAWFKNLFGEWTLRPPQEAFNLIQRRSYATKKAIITTNKRWRLLGSEFLFRCLFFNDPSKLHALCAILDSSSSSASTVTSSLGWWTRRLHLTRYYASASRGTTMADMENALITIIRHCPNLEIFIVDWPMGNTFGPVADALATYARRSLRTVHWHVPCEAVSKVIWALDSLPNVLSVHIEFDQPDSETEIRECINLGAAFELQLTLLCLQQLSLRGHSQEFLEQAAGWSLPQLKALSLDSGNNRSEQPDAVPFLEKHGSQLIFLDLYCIPSLNVPLILDLCPKLVNFAFNADWRIDPPSDNGNGNEDTGTAVSNTMTSESTLVYRPHANITSIGLHGLLYAFGVGIAASYAAVDPLSSHVIRRSNDLNMAALNKSNFPKLERVRALNRSVLIDLNKANGPAEEDGGLQRWETWWGKCYGMGVRLEDCTGAELGTLPEDESDEESNDSDEYDDEDESGEWSFEIPPIEEESDDDEEGGGGFSELRRLVEECREMAEERDDMFMPPMIMVNDGMGPS